MKIIEYLKKGDKSQQGGEVVEEQISFPICHINIVSGCFIIISMSTRGWLKIFVVQEKGEQGSGEEDWWSLVESGWSTTRGLLGI